MDAGIPGFGYAWCRHLGLDHDTVWGMGPDMPLDDFATALRAGCTYAQLRSGVDAGIRPSELTVVTISGVELSELLAAAHLTAPTPSTARWRALAPYATLRRARATHLQALEAIAAGVDANEHARGLGNGVEHATLIELPKGSVAAYLVARDQGLALAQFRLLYAAGLTSTAPDTWGLVNDVLALLDTALTARIAEYLAGLAPSWEGWAEELGETIESLIAAEDAEAGRVVPSR